MDEKRDQTGQGSKPLKFKFWDTRQGRQSINSWVTRRFSIETITGEVADDANLKQIWDVSGTHKGGWDNDGGIFPGRWYNHHKNLAEMNAEFDQNMVGAKALLRQTFAEIVAKDLQTLKSEFVKKGLQVDFKSS